ncbi:MAG: MerR family transcriptional regulator [Clostridiales bacterium]|nr:MerR family transcriptional regulator [Clostridiales bacterium]
MHIKEFAELTGVSVRTLHYYDEIGLLKPSRVDPLNGYRFYDEGTLERMQEILFYRELNFPLKSIKVILSSPNYNKKEALSKQRELLLLKKQRLERLIHALEEAEKGSADINMKLFDNSEYEAARESYAEEVRAKWGDTAAYKECQKKTAGYSKEKWSAVNSDMDRIFAEFADCVQRQIAPDDLSVQALVRKLQEHITENYYSCTKEILAGLGQMYVSDERFRENINKHGNGTAEFAAAAIDCYCSR